MGNSKSKSKSGSRGKNRDKGIRDSGISRYDEQYNDPQLLYMKRTIEKNPEMFILNNLLMSVQFFGNYEEEIKRVKESMVSSSEADFNKNLPPQKHVLIPDVLQEQIGRHVGFTSSRQTFRPTIEPLQPIRIYVVHDNIDIIEQTYSHYSTVNNSTMYKILLIPTKHQGYVQLQTEEVAKSKKPTSELSSIAENDEQYSDSDSVYGPKPRPILSEQLKHAKSVPNLRENGAPSINHSLSSSNRKAETDCENGSSSEEPKRLNKRSKSKEELLRQQKLVTQSKTHGINQDQTSSNSSGYLSGDYAMDSDSDNNFVRPQSSSKFSRSSSYIEINENWISKGEFPERCFKTVTYTADGRIYNPEEDKKAQSLNNKQRRLHKALKRQNYNISFVSSTEFMKHFTILFKHKLGNCLRFDEETVKETRREGCVLYSDNIILLDSSKHSRLDQYEIIPAIWLQWPMCAQEWLDRPRSNWPDSIDVEKIRDFGCYVVPEGYVPRKGNSNLQEDLEWQLTFPAAERYLETCMTQAQVQVYLIAQMLHKTYMRPIFDMMFSITPSHIRHTLFWMIEEDNKLSKWTDSAMGESLMKLLNSLYFSISQNEPVLRDYFIRNRNLFQRIPCEHLLYTQKQLKRIIENPVMYVFHAMENIRYNDDFFPRLNYARLLNILTADLLTLVNPNVSRALMKDQQEDYESKYGSAGLWDRARNQKTIHFGQFVTNKTLINPRKATDSIMEISVRCAELEGTRLCTLLDFFIQHFIKIADRCCKYRADRQKTNYLNHAERLALLLYEYPSYKDDVHAFRDKIRVLRRRTTSMKSFDEAPETPKRNVESAIFVAPLKGRFAHDSSTKDDSYAETGAGTKQPLKESDSKDKASFFTKVIVHETPYEDPDKEILKFTDNKARPVINSDVARVTDSKARPVINLNAARPIPEFTNDVGQPVLKLADAESMSNESTYI
ncbi:uncharacterized protein LOC108632048 [Ceratina calcarata]|uniref:Uncharacterized protein LOC108632048 n=1 Tax=Ceratina calcarata TaxID=156304 RepID=A0AAJ7NET8_9HYME|nr:uncharacterized protein LOC108632048 [Ceratina calcarata]